MLSFALRSRSLHSLITSDAQRSTIYALSTPPGKGGVAVVRVSGPDALVVWKHIVRPSRPRSSLQPWRMEYCRIVKPGSGSEETLDNGLAVFFKAPKSFTTEDVMELHIHSGRAVIASVLSALSSIPFCRPAEPGEFTRRAFLGGRLDLTQVEGLKDLIDAETETQRQMAIRASGGTMRATYEELRTGIIKCLAMVEALIDFGEGEDIEEGVYAQATAQAHELLETIRSYLADSRRGELIRSGIKLAIFGPPNAGKSSLLNFLAQREAAIVTPIPGTTRDVLELSLDIGGLPIIVVDTAGLRKSGDVVERIGIQRATKAVQEADIKLCVLSLPDLLKAENQAPLPEAVQSLTDPHTLFLFNKADLASDFREKDLVNTALARLHTDSSNPPGQAWVTSLATGDGTREFMTGLATALKHRFNVFETDVKAHAPLITRERHRVLLETTCNHLQAFLTMSSDDIVFGAEELRYAARAVGKVSGAIDVEEVLDSVFSSFCIGK
ncbi:tRNA modification GTPase TrmE [Amanita rubescens]|nr:tRNA modification GTPase TrmE [Amanita rubescens]